MLAENPNDPRCTALDSSRSLLSETNTPRTTRACNSTFNKNFLSPPYFPLYPPFLPFGNVPLQKNNLKNFSENQKRRFSHYEFLRTAESWPHVRCAHLTCRSAIPPYRFSIPLSPRIDRLTMVPSEMPYTMTCAKHFHWPNLRKTGIKPMTVTYTNSPV